MACHAGLCLGQSGKGLSLYERMAGGTRKAEFTGMLLMVERYGLGEVGFLYKRREKR